MHTNPFFTMPADRCGDVHEQPGLSEDALTVQTLTIELQRAGVTNAVFGMVKRHGYLREWDHARWRQAEQELTQARLLQARRRYQAMGLTRMQEVIGEGADEDVPPDDEF